jgi:hypothetical protein
MIHREWRDALADRIESFLCEGLSGPMLGEAFERIAKASLAAGHPDPAIPAITLRLWQEYPDYRFGVGGYGAGSDRFPYAMGSQRLPDASWNAFVRAELFLRSDREMAWPEDQWDPYEQISSPPDALTVILLLFAGIAGLAAVMLLFCRQWLTGGIMAAVGAGLGILWSRLNRASLARKPVPAGDLGAFPFMDQAELAWELREQGRPCAPFRGEQAEESYGPGRIL